MSGRIVRGWLVLIGLYTIGTRSERVASWLGTTTGAVRRLSSPDVALVPNLAGKKVRDNSTSAVYGNGGAYIGSTFVPFAVDVPANLGQ